MCHIQSFKYFTEYKYVIFWPTERDILMNTAAR